MPNKVLQNKREDEPTNLDADFINLLKAVGVSLDDSENSRETPVVSIDASKAEMMERNYYLEEANRALNNLFNSLEEVMFSMDMVTFTISHITPACEKLYGYTPEEFYADPTIWMNLMHPDDLHLISEYNGMQANDTSRVKIRCRIIRKDKAIRWVETSNTPSYDAKGNLVRIDGIVRDVTEKKEAEDALTQSALQLREFFESTPEAINVVDLDSGKFIDFNNNTLKLFKYSAEEYLTKGPVVLSPAVQPDGRDSAAKAMEMIGQAMEGKPTAFEWVHVTSEGLHFPCIVRLSKLSVPGRNLLLGMITDITEKKLAEQKLKESNAWLKKAQEVAHLGSWELDFASGIAVWSEEACRIYGLPPAENEYTYKQWIAFIHPDDLDHVNAEINKARASLSLSSFDHRIIRKDGTIRYVHSECIFQFNAEGVPVGLYGIVHDITDRKKAEQQILKLNESLEEKVKVRTEELVTANKEMEAFSYSVSHDLRAPLRVINGYAKMLQKSLAGKLDEQAEADLKVIMENATHMGNLIDDLLDFSRMGRAPLSKNEVSMTDMVKAVLEEVKAASGVKAEVLLHDFGPATCDPALMKQVWTNLISNAFKYSRKKENAKIEIGATGLNGHRTYYVKDNGAGFDMQHSDKLFTVFQRLHKVTEYEGTGVGLALVQRIVAKHGGKIWAEGKVDEGATFYFTLG